METAKLKQKSQEEYWLRKATAGIQLNKVSLWTDAIVPGPAGYDTVAASFDLAVVEKINRICNQDGMLIYAFYLTALQITLSHYSEEPGLLLVSPVPETTAHPQERLLLLQQIFSGTSTFKEIFTQVKAEVLSACQQEGATIASLERQFPDGIPPQLQQMALRMEGLHAAVMPYPVLMEVVLQQHGQVTLRFNLQLNRVQMSLFLDNFITLTGRLLENLYQPVQEISCIGKLETTLLEQFYHTTVPQHPQETFVHIFEKQVLQTPEAIAVVQGARSYSYASLNEKANRLAHYLLQETTIGKDQLAVMIMDRSPEMMISILAIWKAGGAYIPIDPAYPADRIQTILDDARPVVMLTTYPDMPSGSCPVIVYEEGMASLKEQPVTNLQTAPAPEDLSYIIYTSGSTGRPKGAMVEHRGMLNHLYAKETDLEINPESIIIQNASQCFDISVWQFFAAFLQGGKTVIYGQSLVLEPAAFIRQLAQDQVTILEVVPAYLAEILSLAATAPSLISALQSLHYVMITGETLPPQLVKEWFSMFPGIPLVNAYGPTEASDDITHHHLYAYTEMKRVPIGKTLRNFRIYIVNDAMQLLPIGAKGELCVAGPGVGRGYLNQPEKTAAVFIPDPFRKEENIRLYKTGDIAAYQPDGTLLFFGRKDFQVKIRGHRIELGEIEYQLNNVPGIRNGLVLVEMYPEAPVLAAYYMTTAAVSEETIRQQLQQLLPAYMLPAFYIEVPAFPLTPNGKTDRQALSRDFFPQQGTHTTAVLPETPVQQQLAAIWEDILQTKGIGINDNFFHHGGHSLRATKLIYRIHQELEIKLDLQDIFEAPTIAEQETLMATKVRTAFVHIAPVPEAPHYELSHAQQRLWILSQFDTASPAYNMPGAFYLDGPLDLPAFRQAFAFIIRRHESLRTIFTTVDHLPRQKIRAYDPAFFRLEEQDVSGLENPQEAAVQLAMTAALTPFDLTAGPLCRAVLLQLGKEKYALLFTLHHIISDGWSMNVMINEWLDAYHHYKNQGQFTLPALRIQYRDFAAWQQQQLNGPVLNAHQQYWTSQFNPLPPVPELDLGGKRPLVQRFDGSSISFTVDRDTTRQLQDYLEKSGSTLFMGLLALVNALYFRYTRLTDITIGSPVAGREHADLEGQIGFYVNTLALRTRFASTDHFDALLATVKKVTLAAYEHQLYPFDKLVEDLQLDRNLSGTPLFNSMVVLQNTGLEVRTGFDGIAVKPLTGDAWISQFDLTFNFQEWEGEIQARIEYSTSLYTPDQIRQLSGYLQDLIRIVPAQPTTPLRQLPLFNRENLLPPIPEQVLALEESQQQLAALFEKQAAATPEGIAVVFGTTSLTYRQLNQQANQLAHYLLQQPELQPGNAIGIMAHRSLEMITGMLAIMKAGCPYLPIDPAYPPARIAYIIQDSAISLMLTNEPEPLQGIRCIGLQPDIYRQQPVTNPIHHGLDRQLAYIIYTSGSTGNPKGVMITHRSIVHTLLWRKDYYGFHAGHANLQLPSFSFDSSVEDIFTTLLSGGKLIMLEEGSRSDLAYLGALIVQHRVSHLLLVPSLYQLMLQQLPEVLKGLTAVTVAGEALMPALMVKHFATLPDVQLINEYGPTENSVCSTVKTLTATDTVVTIGHPITHVALYILDEDLLPVPAGVKGEICVAGNGLATGYWKKEQLTAEKFVANPLRPEERLYRTGDLGRYTPSGEIEYLGRMDDQVKIRGFRIEIGEIENVLMEQEGIESAAVTVREHADGDKYLAAYLTGHTILELEQVKKSISDKLPQYMLPQAFMQVVQLPLSPNGKVDKTALPQPDKTAFLQSQEYEAPATPLEKQLVNLWETLLKQSRIGINDNFFELGGHSLKATQLVSAIHQELQIKITLNQLFRYPTVKSLAAVMQEQEQDAFSSIPVAPEAPYYDLSYAQRRFWILDQYKKDQTAFNISTASLLEGLNEAAFIRAFEAVVERHEILRTVFIKVAGEIKQQVLPMTEAGISLVPEDLRHTAAPLEAARRIIHEAEQTRFDLEKGPLLKTRLLRISDTAYVFVYTLHHIIADGWSVQVMLDDMKKAYQAVLTGQPALLPPLEIQYVDYAAWANARLSGNNLRSYQDFWWSYLGGELPVMQLPLDFSRPSVKTYNGDVLEFDLTPALTLALQQSANREGASLFMILVAIVQVLCYKYTGQSDIITGTDTAGRIHPELENQIGLYLNTLALRNQVDGGNTFRAFLQQVKDNTLQAFDHQLYPFEQLVDDLKIESDTARLPLFDVMVLLQNFDQDNSFELGPGVKAASLQVPANVSKFDLLFEFSPAEDKLVGSIEYNTDLFKKETIVQMKEAWLHIAAMVTTDDQVMVSAIELPVSSQEDEEMNAFLAAMRGE